MSATVTRVMGGNPLAPGGKKSKGSLTLTPTTSKTKEVDDLLSGMSAMTNQIDNLALAAASEKDAKQRAERELEVERSKLKAHERKDKAPRPAGGAGGKSARDQQVLDELAQLGIGIDGAESNVKKSKEEHGRALDAMRVRAEAAEAAGKKLEGDLATVKAHAEATEASRKKLGEELNTAKANAEATELSRRKLEGELFSARAEAAKLATKIKEDYEKHLRSDDEHVRKEQELEDELASKEELLDKVIKALKYYRARLEAYGGM